MPQTPDSGVPVAGQESVAARREQRPKTWWPDLAALAVLAALTWALAAGHLLRLDVNIRDWVDGHRPTPLYVLARAGNLLGQGGFLTFCGVALSAWLAWRWRTWWPLLPVVTAFALTFVSLTALKAWTDRAAPHALGPQPQELHSGGISYPSGHLANAIVWYGLLAMLLPLVIPGIGPRWLVMLRWVPPVVLLVTTTYLGYHWLTDSVAGLALGIVLHRLRARLPELKPRQDTTSLRVNRYQA
jgi:membrane-associated phospholipid phosphatase